MQIKYTDTFLKEVKKLSKKFKFIKDDLKQAVDEINSKNSIGVSIGYDLYKKRVKNSSIPTGKSGGFRVIIYKRFKDSIVLLTIYSKTQKENLSDNELKELLEKFMNKKK